MGGSPSIATRRPAGSRPQSAPVRQQQGSVSAPAAAAGGVSTVSINNNNHKHTQSEIVAAQQRSQSRSHLQIATNNTSSHAGGGWNGNDSGAGHSNIDTDAPHHSDSGLSINSGGNISGLGGNSGLGDYNNPAAGSSSVTSSSGGADSGLAINSGTNLIAAATAAASTNGAPTSGGSSNATPDSARRRAAPRHFIFPPVDAAATAAASAIVERYASMDALIGHHSHPNHLPALLECAVESTGVVPFFSASYFALQCDPTLQLDAPNVALSRQLRMALVKDRARMLQSLDALWEVYTAHWLKSYACVHVGAKAAIVVLGYLQVQPKKRHAANTATTASTHQSRHSHHSQQSGTSSSSSSHQGHARETSLSGRSPATGHVAVTSATGTALSMMMTGSHRTSAKSASVSVSTTSTTQHVREYESTVGPSTTAPSGLRIAVDDDSDSILSNNGSGLGIRVIYVEDSPKFKLQPIRKGMINNQL